MNNLVPVNKNRVVDECELVWNVSFTEWFIYLKSWAQFVYSTASLQFSEKYYIGICIHGLNLTCIWTLANVCNTSNATNCLAILFLCSCWLHWFF